MLARDDRKSWGKLKTAPSLKYLETSLHDPHLHISLHTTRGILVNHREIYAHSLNHLETSLSDPHSRISLHNARDLVNHRENYVAGLSLKNILKFR